MFSIAKSWGRQRNRVYNRKEGDSWSCFTQKKCEKNYQFHTKTCRKNRGGGKKDEWDLDKRTRAIFVRMRIKEGERGRILVKKMNNLQGERVVEARKIPWWCLDKTGMHRPQKTENEGINPPSPPLPSPLHFHFPEQTRQFCSNIVPESGFYLSLFDRMFHKSCQIPTKCLVSIIYISFNVTCGIGILFYSGLPRVMPHFLWFPCPPAVKFFKKTDFWLIAFG